MRIKSSQEMVDFGEKVAKWLEFPAVLELTGDVGVGKTTFTRGLAKGLKVSDDISSPSFTISKRYALPSGGELVHYDFYRLDDAGIMRDELAETLASGGNIVVVEWGESVADLFDGRSIKINFTLAENGEREIEVHGLEIPE